ncbi:hypothetical protein DL98DRAFT_601627 [Cadophora sp. DSE1049]|nr:hypothetical protein DL98DRAFT_601627 [Cadophora sp. DSE1049]
MPKAKNVVTEAAGRQAAEDAAQSTGKRSQPAKKKAATTFGELPPASEARSILSKTAAAEKKSGGGKASKPLSKSSSTSKTPSQRPSQGGGPSNMTPKAASTVWPPGMRNGNGNGSSSQVSGNANSTSRRVQRTMSTPLPSTHAGKKQQVSTRDHSEQTKTRSMSVPSLKALSSVGKINPTSTVQKYIPVNPKQNKRFYEALIMLSVLGKSRGGRIPEKSFQHKSTLEAEKGTLRRLFIRSLAYLCDSEKGGSTTTAIALQQAPKGGVVYWLASNSCSKGSTMDRSKMFLEDVLCKVQRLQAADDDQVRAVEKQMFRSAVSFSESRIKAYRMMLKSDIEYVLMNRMESGIADNGLIEWLRDIQCLLNMPEELCNFCYEERRSAHFADLTERARPGGLCARRFKNIRHNTNRLGHTMKAVRAVVSAAAKLQPLLSNFSVVRAPSGFASPPPLEERNPTLEALAGRMTDDEDTIEQIRGALDGFDRMLQLSKELQRSCTAQTWRPQVHAELVLNDLFLNRKLKFVDEDRYIACSKAACFCCYHYIKAQGQFVVPACHNNVWVNWKAPDILNHSRNEASITKRRNILNTMTKHIRAAVLDQIISRRGPMTWKPDTATDISSVRMHNMREPKPPPSEDPEDPSENTIDSTCSSESDSSVCEEQFDTAPGLFDEDEDSDECEPELVGKWELTEEFEVAESEHEYDAGSGEDEDLKDGYWSDDRSDLSDDEVDGGVSLFA